VWEEGGVGSAKKFDWELRRLQQGEVKERETARGGWAKRSGRLGLRDDTRKELRETRECSLQIHQERMGRW